MNSKKHLQQLNFETLSIPPTINESDEFMLTSDSPMPPTLSRLTLMNTQDPAPSFGATSSNAQSTPARIAVGSNTPERMDVCEPTPKMPPPPRQALMNTHGLAQSSNATSNAEGTHSQSSVESPSPDRMDVCEPTPKMPPPPRQALMNTPNSAPSSISSSNAEVTPARNAVESYTPNRMDICEPSPKMPTASLPSQALMNNQDPAPSSGATSLNAQTTSARSSVGSNTPSRMDISGPSPQNAAPRTLLIPGRFGCSLSFNNRPTKRRFINSSLYVNGNEETVERLQKELAESKSTIEKLQAKIAKRDAALSLQQQSQQQNIELTEINRMLSQELEKRSLEKKECEERMEKMQQEFLIATNSWGSLLDHFQAFRHLMNNTLAQKEIDYAKSVECNQKLLAENAELKKMRTREEYEKAQTEILKLRILRDKFLEKIGVHQRLLTEFAGDSIKNAEAVIEICKKMDKWKMAASNIS